MEAIKPVGCIKIDAEGREAAALRGAENILLRDHPSLIVKMKERRRPGSLMAVRRYLADLGYQGFFFEGGCLRPIESLKGDRYRKAASATGISAYVNSFLFFGGPSLPGIRHLVEGHC